MEKLNRAFRDTYAAAREAELHSIKAIVVARFSCATLFIDGHIVETARVIPSQYHNLRYCAHVPFTLYMKLSPHVDRQLDPATTSDLREYLAAVQAAGRTLDTMPYTPDQRTRQHFLLEQSTRLIDEALAHGRVGAQELREYARNMSDPIRANTREAGIAQVDGLHAQMVNWRQRFPNADWEHLFVAVHGPQQARCDYVVTQYFAALFQDRGDDRGYPGESRRVVYCEDNSTTGDPPWDADLKLLAAVNLDAEASEAIFVDPDRLSMDVMADGAREYLKTFRFKGMR